VDRISLIADAFWGLSDTSELELSRAVGLAALVGARD
jgi:hypothetical protein